MTISALGDGGRDNDISDEASIIKHPYTHVFVDNVYSMNDLVDIFFPQHFLQSKQLMIQDLVMSMACNALMGVANFPLQGMTSRHQ